MLVKDAKPKKMGITQCDTQISYASAASSATLNVLTTSTVPRV
jgi:hypothetical protein